MQSFCSAVRAGVKPILNPKQWKLNSDSTVMYLSIDFIFLSLPGFLYFPVPTFPFLAIEPVRSNGCQGKTHRNENNGKSYKVIKHPRNLSKTVTNS